MASKTLVDLASRNRPESDEILPLTLGKTLSSNEEFCVSNESLLRDRRGGIGGIGDVVRCDWSSAAFSGSCVKLEPESDSVVGRLMATAESLRGVDEIRRDDD